MMILVCAMGCAVGETVGTATSEQGLDCGDNCDPGGAQALISNIVGGYGFSLFPGGSPYLTSDITCHTVNHVTSCTAGFHACTDQGCGTYQATCDSLGPQDCWYYWN
jgi:hypothetical protein